MHVEVILRTKLQKPKTRKASPAQAGLASRNKTRENETYSSGVNSGVEVGVSVARGRAVADALAVFPA